MAQTKIKLIADGVIDVNNLAAGHTITTDNIGEGSNLYYTDARVASYLATGGNIGIGTDSASVPLEVDIAGGGDVIRFTRDTGTNGALSLDFSGAVSNFNSEQGGYTFSFAGSEKMRIESNGNVGIGRSPVTYGSFKVLDVAGTNGAIQKWIHTGSTVEAQLYASSTLVNIGSATNHPVIFSQNNTERMRIDASGNVIVGSTTANNVNAATLRQDGTAHVNNVQLANAAGSVGGTTPSIYSPEAGQLAISLNSAERLRINGSGNVGIGTTSPAAALTVRKDGASAVAEAIRLQNLAAGNNEGNSITWYSADGISSQIKGQNSTYSYGSVVIDAFDNDKSTIAATFGVAGTLTGTTDVSGFYFETAGVRRARIDGDGLKFGTDTAAANALDDYEEGTWTPNVGGNATYTFQSGYYTKIGRVVHINFTMVISSIGTGSANLIYGIPFITPASRISAGSIYYWENTSGSYYMITPIVDNNNNFMRFRATSVATATIQTPSTLFTNGTRIDGSITYFAS